MLREPSAICTVAIIILTTFTSLIGFRDSFLRERFLFSVREVLAGKQYYRLITSAFLHADATHLILNMVSLYCVGRIVEGWLGPGEFLLIYGAAIVGGDLLSLWIHRHHEYRSYGASGGVCGIIFCFALLFPEGNLGFFFLPAMPAWLYAVVYLVASFFALRRRSDNVGHDAHLGGAIIGFWTVAALHPILVRENLKTFLGISILSVLLFVYLAKNPLFLPMSVFLKRRPSRKSDSEDFPKYKRDAIAVDSVLEKISRDGMQSLTREEKAVLDGASEKFRRRADSQKPDSDLTI